MPTFTQTGFAFELAKARAGGIEEAASLLATLADAGVSSTVVASALSGLSNEATAIVDDLAVKVDDEAGAKAAAKPKSKRKANAAPLDVEVGDPPPTVDRL